ncbi:MAG: 23S rRNA (pseudouridine(1915)-N(3))-methyltransferase RlmH [Bacteroidales bacterium]
MRLTVIFTGKTKERYLKEGVGEYLKRMERYAPLTSITIPDPKISGKADREQVKRTEGEQILKNIRPGDHVILLDEAGQMFGSVEFAKHLSALEGRTGHAVFVIGGPYGFSDEVYRRADAKISLSAMTFSHQMVRLIFTEQLYRAYTILRGEPYHHN